MLWTPASAAFDRHALPDSESRLTIMMTVTPSLIMLSQISPNFATSPPALSMIDSTPASSNAAFRLGRSLASHRGEVVSSGRITPTLPSAFASPPASPSLPPSESLPHAARAPNASTPTATRDAKRAPLFLTISSTSMVRINRDRRHVIAVTAYVVRHNILTDPRLGKHLP